ncbi:MULTISPECIES: MerR family transcriptional regulator [unclassified Cryobacterium]|nr:MULTISPECIES: MerR family transcriptional regulator [Cryobacterium]MDY7526358.1 MerR family transcriptional regulator [Cryobacterium sp. 10C2]MDY7557838.1 MerR family transcriptional regulator [Cryobacterium sp. 10C3]MEB0003783.1 MerR family transcriptional regulator [Cryobacterium sp. RTC2.1]MEB0203628.1 MerR family transcriptional regulator [Cryobacterium sp. 5I3]MEB0287874.1 MerR family transcriptional regulator [Cryobacterium sp. 10S3]
MLIAELALRAGVKISTVRFYERTGVLAKPERTNSGYRDYRDSDVRRMRFLRRGQELGFTLAELHEFDRFSQTVRAGSVTAGDVAEVAAQKLREIDEKIADLQRTSLAIKGLLEVQCVDASVPCPIVSALAGQ